MSRRSKPVLESSAQSGLRADPADEHDLATGPEHARELVERGFGIGNGGDDVLRDDDIEGAVRKRQVGRIHDGQTLDVAQTQLLHPLLRPSQHRLRDIDPEQAARGGIIGQRYARTYTDLQNAPADSLRGGNSRVPAAVENGTKYQIVNRRPARISLCNRIPVELCHFAPRLSSAVAVNELRIE